MNLLNENSGSIRIAHISDLHFSKITFSPTQFLTKRWIGNLNLLLFRRNLSNKTHLDQLPSLFAQNKVDLVIISGDLSSTSQDIEFTQAKAFIKELEKRNIPSLVLPGNHDHYTKEAFKKKLFYQYFSNNQQSLVSSHKLKDNRLEIHQLTDKWWIITLDTVIPTPLLSSQGVFSKELEMRLEEVLQNAPKDISIILVNHFPFFQHDSPHNRLVRGSSLKALLRKYPNVKIYLHGHTHRQCTADLRAHGLPVLFDPGCCGNINNASWHLLDISHEGYSVKVYQWKKLWKIVREAGFSLQEQAVQVD